MSDRNSKPAGSLRGDLYDAARITDRDTSCIVDDVVDIVRGAFDEIAESFDAEARDRADDPEFGAVGVRQAEAAATYIRCVRDTKFPLPKE